MYRLINYVFGLTLIYLFILEGRMEDHIQVLIALGLAIILATLSFLANWITLDATKAVIIVGTILLGFGGWILAASVIFFFIISSLLSSRSTGARKSNGVLAHHMRRDGYQVWANSFWAALFCILWFASGAIAALVAAFAVIATATADTWATEVGTKNPGKTVMITNFTPVEPGVDGGISLKGTVAAFFGACAISTFIFLTPFSSTLTIFFIVLGAGFVATIADSILGALLKERRFSFPEPEDFSSETESFSNSVVNWISTGIGGIAAFTLTQVIIS